MSSYVYQEGKQHVAEGQSRDRGTSKHGQIQRNLVNFFRSLMKIGDKNMATSMDDSRLLIILMEPDLDYKKKKKRKISNEVFRCIIYLFGRFPLIYMSLSTYC